jgi:hypothetical protein
MANKYIALIAGALAQVEALVSSAGAADAGKIPALDAGGKLDSTVMPTGIGADTKSMVASENLTAGDLVNVWSDSGTEKMRKADATNGRRAHGFVKSGVTSGASGTMYKSGTVTGLSARTPGAQQYLSGNTPGAFVETAPSTTGYIVQDCGVALSATEVSFEPQPPVTLA